MASHVSALARKEDDRLISTHQVCRLFRCHRSTIQRRLRSDPRFPKPVRNLLSANSFWESEVYAYLEATREMRA